MTIEEAELIMQNELDCVLRNEAGKCNRDCANCDLVLPTKDVILAYEMVIKNLEAWGKVKAEITEVRDIEAKNHDTFDDYSDGRYDVACESLRIIDKHLKME